ncbi:hypothetical protein [Pseudomonas sp. EMN2]|uniref:hypothetical protein n=1 Tax=Pseudomonas sp. EMN2 TaxID=2615212 RepID=UPI00129B39BF|nr:hypothetical protein [Pseudomonas sp. EMN2]
MTQKVTFKPESAEYQVPGDNVARKNWVIKRDGVEVGSISSQIRDLYQSYTTPGYSVTVTVELVGVEQPYRQNSGTFSNRSKREAQETRSTYVRRAKQWATRNLNLAPATTPTA